MLNSTDKVLVVEAGRTESLYWKDLWSYRSLFYFLAWRDLLVRYKQTVIGIAWSVIRPLLTMIVFTIVFSKLAKLPSGNIPYPILVFAAMLPWQFFSNALSESSSSLITSSNMLTKVYFPRLIVPISTVIVSLVDFLISFVILILLMAWYKFIPSVNIIFLPAFMVLLLIVTIGAGLWLSALNVKYRDFRYVVPFIIQFGLYISPVGFSSSVIPSQWRFLYYANPMVGIIDGFRWAMLGSNVVLYWPGFLFSIILSLIIFTFGLWYFRKTEHIFADIV